LFEVVAGPLAQPRTPGVSFAGLRTVAFDGLNSLKVPGTVRNRDWIGRIRHLPAQHAATRCILDTSNRPLTTRHCVPSGRPLTVIFHGKTFGTYQEDGGNSTRSPRNSISIS
jgi:hypothetical protein